VKKVSLKMFPKTGLGKSELGISFALSDIKEKAAVARRATVAARTKTFTGED
jgi:hypothetical protein